MLEWAHPPLRSTEHAEIIVIAQLIRNAAGILQNSPPSGGIPPISHFLLKYNSDVISTYNYF